MTDPPGTPAAERIRPRGCAGMTPASQGPPRPRAVSRAPVPFAHLTVHSAFSLLDGADAPETLVAAAQAAGWTAVALTDSDGVGGAVRFQKAAEARGIRGIVGAEVTLADGGRLPLLADGPEGYATLCRLLTRANLDAPRGAPRLAWEALEEGTEGLHCLTGDRAGPLVPALLAHRFQDAAALVGRLRRLFPGRLHIEVTRARIPGERAVEAQLHELAERYALPEVAAYPVRHARREGMGTYDLLVCARVGVTVDTPHPARPLNAEGWLADPAAVRERWSDRPQLLAEAARLAASLRPVFQWRTRRYPEFVPAAGETPRAMLRRLALEGVRWRYPRPDRRLMERLEHELAVIHALGFDDYFLIMWDVARFARSRGIRFAGRGSAADSVVAYLLGLTEVDAHGRELLFERFMSLERAEQPDIDIDIDARHRDTVAAYVEATHGPEHVAHVATYATFRARSAVRVLGKALGFGPDVLDGLARRLPLGLPADGIEEAWSRYPELRAQGSARRERLGILLQAAASVAGLAHHVGTHLGGLVITRGPVMEVSPLIMSAKGVRIIAFDRDDVEDLGLLKMDLLSLRALSVVEDTFAALPPGTEARVDDPDVYAPIRAGDTIGVFQLESPAQRALQSQLGADRFEDIVHSLALIRPGPIQGNMVDPYLRRRAGREAVGPLHPLLEPILRKTYGVVLFQEQVIEIASRVAGFAPGEADRLRRVMTHARSRAAMAEIGREFVARAVARGMQAEVAAGIFETVAGYASYGFCEAHAAAFATTALKTAYLSRHHPAAFFAALLSHQPMGFYPPSTLVTEARRRGVVIRGVDVNRSAAAFTVEDGAIRIGLRAVRGVGEEGVASLLAARARGPFTSLADFMRRTRASRDLAAALVRAGAFDAVEPSRRWALMSVHECSPAGLFALAPVAVEDFSPLEKRRQEAAELGFDRDGLLWRHIRPQLRRLGLLTTREVQSLPAGRSVRLAGIPIRPHRPPTRSGRRVVFFSLEDECGLCDVTMFDDVYQRSGGLLFTGRSGPVVVDGTVQRRGSRGAIVARRLWPWPS